ncbi:MAG: protease SohB [Gammaproteobacteria bacterium]|jgi:serine protease SohB|nr:protease SohB [Gammaproteobacteria bacterium]MBT3694186.1 protease SohB [Gammaproteobacteria bacterium]MBT5333793.1 protease SohB [Gammaproteobacteria bacterium]MBT5682338.1 protease SohB [Gammaproteobacteria bacterium]MBT6025957.1 protease SohB [Gammaproteobacteria bacterium]|tara:strand:- start:498 stop:1631 length:1134 start_codon:yes stop_codon:yes gene_type:complete
MDFLFEYLMFLGQVVTLVVAFLIIASSLAGLSGRQHGDQGHLVIRKLNERVRELRFTMENHLLTAEEAKRQHKSESKSEKAEAKKAAKAAKLAAKQKPGVKKTAVADEQGDSDAGTEGQGVAEVAPKLEGQKDRTFVIHFDGDTAASGVDFLSVEISAVLTMAGANDEVVICLESPGGMVHSYGLAASQMMRIRNKGIPLTAIVDRVAASGGYLMAAVANKILAAPFAVIGSIGVVAQIPNLHRLLKKNDVDVEVLTAGKYKRTLTLLGENTDEGREKFREELEDVHALFQEFVAENRPELDIEAVATGEAWYGKRALELNLVDGLATSDEYLIELCETRDVFEVTWEETKKPIDRVLDKFNGMLDKVSHVLEFVRK